MPSFLADPRSRGPTEPRRAVRGAPTGDTWEVTLAAGVLLVAAVLGQTAEP